MCVCVCVCVRAACVCACVRACVRVCELRKRGLLMLLLLRYTISLYVEITCNPNNTLETEHCSHENVVLYSCESLESIRIKQCLLKASYSSIDSF